MRLFFRTISVLFHPVFLSAALSAVYYSRADLQQNLPVWQSLQIIVTNTLLFPLATVLILKGLGWVKSIQLHEQRDRIIPTIASMTFYFWAYLVARNKAMDPAMVILLLSGFISFVVLILLGIVMKPSLHASAWAIALGWVWSTYALGEPTFLAPALIISIVFVLVIWARHYLGAHRWSELIWGSLAGLLSIGIAYGFLGW